MFLKHCALPLALGFLFIIMKNRYINTRFWSDSWIRQKLNPLDRYLFIYFLTNEHTNICGIYEIPIEIIAFETGLDENDLNKSLLPRLKPKIIYKNNYIIVPNFIKHQNIRSPKVITGIMAEISQIPKDIIKIAIEYGYPIDTISHLNSNSNSNLNSNSNINTKRILNAYKEKINKNTRDTDNARNTIKARLNNYTEPELLKAIDTKSKDSWFMANCANRGITWFFESKKRIGRYIEETPKKQINNRIS